MRVRSLGRNLVRVLEVLSLLSLLGTGEVHPLFLIAVIGYFVISGILQFRSNTPPIERKWLWWIVALLILVTFSTVYRLRIDPLIVGAHFVPCLQILLSFSGQSVQSYNWRILAAFVSLTVSVALTPELYLAAILFLFVILASVSTACLFIESEIESKSPETGDLRLPKTFLLLGAGLSTFVFAASLIIFPLLPRPNPHSSMGFGGGKSLIGYRSSVDLNDVMDLAGSETGDPVLRVFLPNDHEIFSLDELIPHLLIRGETLSSFDGNRWSRSVSDRPTHLPSAFSQKTNNQLEFIREALQKDILFTPYLTRRVDMIQSGQPLDPRTQGGYRDSSAIGKRVRYEVQMNTLEYDLTPPKEEHLEVPPHWVTQVDFDQLSESVFGNQSELSVREKALAISNYLATKGFKASYNQNSEFLKNSLRQSPDRSLTYFLDFLNRTKEGHCELFSTLTALLLRYSGTPARLSVGFKVNRERTGTVVTLRQGDAHAWVEAWHPDEGWKPIDLTPSYLVSRNSLLDSIQDRMDYLSAYWNRFVVSFDPTAEKKRSLENASNLWNQFKDKSMKWHLGPQETAKVLVQIVLILSLLLVSLLLVRWELIPRAKRLFSSIRKHSREFDRDLWVHRRRMDRFLRSAGFKNIDEAIQNLNEHSARESLIEWKKLYQIVRFGPIEPDHPEWKVLNRCLHQIWAERGNQWRHGLS